MDTDTPNLPLSDSHVDWRYEMRREMQLIVPGLWLGPFSSAKNEANLKRCGITHIVCVRDGAESRIIRPLFPSEFVYLEITASDSPFQNLIPLFPQSKLFIDSALGKGGVVFVHCNGGISMAPAFVIAYLMETYLQDYQHAFEFVQTKRFCMNPNEGFKLQLKVCLLSDIIVKVFCQGYFLERYLLKCGFLECFPVPGCYLNRTLLMPPGVTIP